MRTLSRPYLGICVNITTKQVTKWMCTGRWCVFMSVFLSSNRLFVAQDSRMKRIENLLKKQLAVPCEFEEHPFMPTQDYVDELVCDATYPSPLVLPGEMWRGLPRTTRRFLQSTCVPVIRSATTRYFQMLSVSSPRPFTKLWVSTVHVKQTVCFTNFSVYFNIILTVVLSFIRAGRQICQ